ncbi:MAG TPA: GTPase HflX [Kofleriaceae bacterium]|nr:GTPase HflX [Kofleriaceae bacterium]
MSTGESGQRPRAVLVAVQLPGVSEEELRSSLAELARLGTTLGLDVAGEVTQRRYSLAAGKVLGDGKLIELAKWTGGTGVVEAYQRPGSKRRGQGASDGGGAGEADTDVEVEEEEGAAAADDASTDEDDASTADDEDADADDEPRASVVLVDHDLTPTQQRNLERATGAEVHDRTSVILGIFHRHARTREARLQVEIARLAYLAPRLREGGGGDRVRGGIGGKGAGESSLELDRRRIRDRVAELRRELASIEGTSRVRRGRRSDLPTVALVGYTNAGKSSLMRALTGSDVYVADKLFATLDTTVRVLAPRTDPPILVSDTVGFIKKLPHDLVASFRSTLEEAGEADLLLRVVDASDPALREQMRVTGEVLGEVGADAPGWILLNKMDRVDPATAADLAVEMPDAVPLSALRPDDVAGLRDRIMAHFFGELEVGELAVPWVRHQLVNAIHERCHILSETHDADGTRLEVRAPRRVLERLRAEIAAQPAET